MKILITNYSFNAASKTVTFNDYPAISLASILLITNETTNPPVIIYNFAASGGTVSGNVLTLVYDTTTMSNSDRLQIYYDDTSLIPATQQEQLDTQDLLSAQIMILQQLNALTNALNGNNINATLAAGANTIGSINAITTLPTLANVTTVAGVTTVSTVTNLSQIGAANAAEYIYNQSQMSAAQANLANIYYS